MNITVGRPFKTFMLGSLKDMIEIFIFVHASNKFFEKCSFDSFLLS
jgi:hypothetical protein